MGGYGVLNVAGAAYSEFAINFFKGMTGGSNALAARGSASEEYQNSMDPRIKAVVAFAPWGMERGVWDAETLKGLKTPTLFVAGDQDDVSGYEKGIKAIYERRYKRRPISVDLHGCATQCSTQSRHLPKPCKLVCTLMNTIAMRNPPGIKAQNQ